MTSDPSRFSKFHPGAWVDRMLDLLTDLLDLILDSRPIRRLLRWSGDRIADIDDMVTGTAVRIVRRLRLRMRRFRRHAPHMPGAVTRVVRGFVRPWLLLGERVASLRPFAGPTDASSGEGEIARGGMPAAPATVRTERTTARATGRRSRTAQPKVDRADVEPEPQTFARIRSTSPGAVSIIHCWHCRGTTAISAPRLGGCHLCSYCGQVMEVSDLMRGLSRAPKRIATGYQIEEVTPVFRDS